MSVGRNDPCPCGSGKKHKKCCLPREERRNGAAPPDEPPDVRRGALSAVLRFAATPEHARSFEGAARALDDSQAGPQRPELADDEQVKFTFYWLFDHLGNDGRSLAEIFLLRGGVPILAAEQRMIRRWIRARLRPYEVVEVRAEEGLQLRDLWSNETAFVTERAATRQLAKWDLLAARVAPGEDGTRRFEGGLYVLPPRIKQGLLDALRDEERRLRRLEPELTEDRFFKRCAPLIHRTWLREVASRPMPALVTAEGDPMVFGKVVFDVFNREGVALALGGHAEISAERDGSYTWIEECDDGFTRSLGQIVLEDDRLVLEVTSRTRADRGRRLIERAAGKALRHRATRFEGVEQALQRQASKPRKAPADPIPPELAAPIIEEYKKRHYSTWPDHPLPALDGKTPRQAVRSRTLRPRVVDLLKDMENMETRAARPDNPAYDFGPMWKDLGLERPT